MSELKEMLAAVPLFARLKPRDLERLAGRMSERRWSEGETVIAEGKGGIGFWVIQDGSATVSVAASGPATTSARSPCSTTVRAPRP